ncbi:MAG TPA: glycosyltransferase family 39 protein [bacterium]|nr:glycosyltransferase family 39 protein [bacterium]
MSARARRAWIVAIVALAGLLRLAWLGSNPPGTYCDEAAVGYNAFTVETQGTDEFGARWPLFFRSFGEYKNPVYVYADAPVVAALGLSPFSARLPAALFGTATVLAAILLSEAWFGTEAGLLTGGLLAVSPWHLLLSRVAFEAVSFPLFLALGMWQLGIALERRSIARSVLAGALLGITPYCYGPAKLVVPVLVAAVLLLRRDVPRDGRGREAVLVLLATLALAAVPLVALRLRHPEIDSRLGMIGVGSEYAWKTSLAAQTLARLPNGIAAAIEASRPLRIAWSFVVGYGAHLDPGFLFLWGDPNDRHGTHNAGLMLPAEAPLFVAGLIALWRRRAETAARIVWVWLLAAPLAPALTLEGLPHAIRMLGGLPAVQMTCALGIPALARAVAPRLRAALATGWSVSAAASLWVYFVVFPAHSRTAFQASAPALVRALNAYPERYCEVRVVDGYERFHTLWGFYSAASPEAVRQMEFMNRYRCRVDDPAARLAIARADRPLARCAVLATVPGDDRGPGWVLQQCAPARSSQ